MSKKSKEFKEAKTWHSPVTGAADTDTHGGGGTEISYTPYSPAKLGILRRT